MRHFAPLPVFRVLTILLVAAPPAALAQSRGASPAAAPGWGSVWLEPANEQQRKQRELLGKIKAAQQAHDTRAQLQLCDQLIALTPNSAAPYVVRAYAHGQARQFDRALTDLDEAQEIAQKQQRPEVSANLLLVRANVHAHQKNYPAAVSDLQASLKLNGKNEQTFNSLAWLRATAPDASVRNGPESVRLAQKAVALSTEDSYTAVDTLAAAYAEANEYPRAIESEKRAMTAAEKQIKDAAKAQKFQREAAERLRLFEQHQAYHAELP